MTYEENLKILDNAELLFDESACQQALQRVADEITAKLSDSFPLVLPVMGGAVVFTGRLLPLLQFPLDFDYVHISRYGDKLKGGEFVWKRTPQQEVKGRNILILDDILDEGYTMAAIHEQVMNMGALSCHSAVFAEKDTGKEKPIRADFVGISVPDRYVFGYGMDVQGAWRNLPAVYALKSIH